MDSRMEQFRSCLLENVIGKSFGLGNLSAAGASVYGSSGNPLFAAFRRTLCMDSVPRPRGTSMQEDMVSGVRWAQFFMGSLEAAVVVTVCAPMERVKLLLQNQGELIRTGRLCTPYLGIKDCLSRTIRNEGVLSLWKGSFVNVSRWVLVMSFGAQLNEIALKSTKDKHQEGLEMQSQNHLAAASLCLYPLDYAYTRLANDIKCGKGNGERKFNSLLDLYKKTFKSDGVAGLFRGLNLGLLALLTDNGYNLLLQPQIHNNPSKGNQLLVTSFLATTSMLVSYSLNTIQRRMMMTSGEVTKYKGSMDAVRQIIKNEGMKSLCKGFGADVLSIMTALICILWFRKMEDSKGTISVVIHRD